jgi:hypothetical protein
MHKSYDRREKIFTSFEKNVTTNDSITFGDNSQGKVLGHGKIAITTKHSISKVLVESFTIIYFPFHNFVRSATIIYSTIRV